MQEASAEIEVPRRWRAVIRARESSLVLIAVLVGTISGGVVAGMAVAVDLLHQLFYGLAPGQRLSGLLSINPWLALSVPTLGGLLLGIASQWIATRRHGPEIDPIEANALHGGRMSLVGSAIVAAQTVWSSGVGASVGLEAGYTQLASGIASRLGRAFRLRRSDLRTILGCGAAGGIAGAFGAPIAGAFYAFELVIGNYSVATLAPVGISAVIGYSVAHGLSHTTLGVVAPEIGRITNGDLAVAGGLGLVAALFGIGLMRGVAWCERVLVRLVEPAALRPALGGLIVGLLAIVSPQVMSSGHGALHLSGVLDLPLRAVALIFVLKVLASVVSLGSGFRGGLFFASLLIGTLGGQLFAASLNMVSSHIYFDPSIYALVGMSALSASVIGAPLTMMFVALESTGNLWLAGAVLIAVIISAQVTREAFGYSFATWRFHLRGETIRSAADVGWIRELTVGRTMRTDVRTAPVDMSVEAFREAFRLGSTGQVVLLDPDGRYAGIVMVADAHAPDLAATSPVRKVLRCADDVLVPSMTVQQALVVFDRTESEALAVIDSDASRKVIGLLSEAHALKRYLAEAELRRREFVEA